MEWVKDGPLPEEEGAGGTRGRREEVGGAAQGTGA